MSIKVMTLNMHTYFEDNQMEKFQKIADFIIDNGVDIVLLQEVNQKKEKLEFEKIEKDNPLEIFSKYILDKINVKYNFVYSYNHISDKRFHEGTAVFTKHEIMRAKRIKISSTDDHENFRRRIVTKATLKIDNNVLDVYSCHFGWADDELEPFSNQFEKLKEQMDWNNNFIVGGDFNIPSNSKEYQVVTNKLYDISKINEPTIKGKIAGWENRIKDNESLKIDYLFADKQYEYTTKIIFNEKDNEVSDHFGVYTKVSTF